MPSFARSRRAIGTSGQNGQKHPPQNPSLVMNPPMGYEPPDDRGALSASLICRQLYLELDTANPTTAPWSERS